MCILFFFIYFAGPGVFLNTSGLQKVADIIQVRSVQHAKGINWPFSVVLLCVSVCPESVGVCS